ncbi:MAG TPA: c-type cytochrome domain-containing protein [Candidatus Binatia bacterium]|nr:c-type cytochrome domain-containing protein [Candidatus Binatia bacterium]
MATKSRTLTLTLILTLALSTFAILAADKGEKKLDLSKVDLSKLPAPAAKTGVTYAADIKPIFEKSCFKCHGPEKQKAKLRLDSLPAALKGGEDGEILVPGKSAESLVVIAVARLGDEDDAMPPADKGDPLTKEQVALIRAWIDQGAK